MMAKGAAAIAILSPSYNIWGGGQIYIEKMCNYISQRQSCYIFTAEPERFSCPSKMIPVIDAPAARLRHSVGIIRSMRRGGISHVVLNDLSAAWLGPLFRLSGFRVISLLHIPLKVSAGGHGRVAYSIIRDTLRMGSHKVLSVNPQNMLIAPEKSVFVGNFVSEPFFTQPGGEKSYDLCFVGRFSWEKNVPLLLRMVALSRRCHQRDLTLLLVGAGPDEGKIRDAVADLGIGDLVTFSGWVEPEELPRVYQSARCFVVASHHEGFATTLLESHACGLPALTTDVGYCGDFVKGHGRETGIIFSDRHLDDLTFFQRLFHLVDGHLEYREECIRKAGLFAEERVLDLIYREILI